MPRPQTKQDLISAGDGQFEKLFKLIDSMPPEEQTAQFSFDPEAMGNEAHWKRDKNIRDVLTHLYEWHRLLLDWINANRSGEQRPFLPEPYTWKTYGEMNADFWEKHQGTPYEKSREMVKESHGAVIALIGTFSDDELFVKKHFKWTGSTSLGSYCVSAAPSHYDWAMKKIKAHIKTLNGKA